MRISPFIRRVMAETDPITRAFRSSAAASPVFDFALGQPCVPHTEQLQAALEAVVQDRTSRHHPYPPSAGRPEAREAVASLLRRQYGRATRAEDVLLTAGAAGALHVVARTLLEPGDEVVTPAPFFLEYKYYCENYGAALVVAAGRDVPALDVEAVADALTAKTRLLLLNSPNNPAGTAYGAPALAALADVLLRFRERHGRDVIVVSDETYHRMHYLERPPASPWALLPRSLLVGSFSKDLGLAGERIGYLCVSPEWRDAALIAAFSTSQRVLGFLNASLIWQRALALALDGEIDMTVYRRKRDALGTVLRGAGLATPAPDGGLFLLIRAPGGDGASFSEALARHGVIVLPGSLYGAPGFVRASFAVDDDMLARSAGAWCAAADEARAHTSALSSSQHDVPSTKGRSNHA